MEGSTVAGGEVLVIGHRGNRARHQENSAAGFRSLGPAGVPAAECDARLTRDGVLVCSHDPSTQRLGGTAEPVADLGLDEVRATALRDGLPVATLDEVLDACSGLAVVVELKNRRDQPGFRADRHQGHVLVELLHRRRERSQVDRVLAVSSFDPAMLAVVAAEAPDLAARCALLGRPLVGHAVLRTAARAGLTQLHLHVSAVLLRPGIVAEAAAEGIAVSAWTVNDPLLARRVVELGVTGVITDHPEDLLPVVGRRPAPRSSA